MGKYGKGLYANVLRDFLSNGYKKNQAKSLDGYQRDDSLFIRSKNTGIL